MSTGSPYTTSLPDPPNIGILLRRPFQSIVDAVDERLAESGHRAIRPAHGNVFQFIEPEGTRVSVLAERAQMTKQSMAELVAHLERHGYVERIPDPTDRRAKLTRLTDKGRAAVPIALAAIDDTAAKWRRQLGPERFRSLQEILQELNQHL
jgi:DNA-binding MarR family transcriptional regulator